MTKGEKIVRTDFNVSGDNEITKIKNLFAKLIDDVELIRVNDGRLVAMVQTKLEDVAMYYVKLLTA